MGCRNRTRTASAERTANDGPHHHGLVSSSFVTPFLSMVGMTSAHGNALADTWPWESPHVEALAWFDHWLTGARNGHPRRSPNPLSGARRRGMAHCRVVADPGNGSPRAGALPAIMSFRHASVGTSSVNTINSSSRLILSVLPAAV